MAKAEQLLKDALKLSTEDRAELAAQLLASLDEQGDEDAEAAWAEEIARRAARARSADDPGSPWPEVCERLEKALRGR